MVDTSAGTSAPAVSLHWLGAGDFARAFRLVSLWPVPGWDVGDLGACLRSVDTAGVVAEVQGQLAGAVVYRMQRALSEVIIRGLVVVPAWRRRGVGTRLLGAVRAKLLGGYDRVSVVVPETATAAQLFLRASGFKAVQVLRSYFGDEAGYVMELQAAEATSQPLGS